MQNKLKMYKYINLQLDKMSTISHYSIFSHYSLLHFYCFCWGTTMNIYISHKRYATLTTLAVVWALWSFKIFIWSELYWWALKERNSCCLQIDRKICIYIYIYKIRTFWHIKLYIEVWFSSKIYLNCDNVSFLSNALIPEYTNTPSPKMCQYPQVLYFFNGQSFFNEILFLLTWSYPEIKLKFYLHLLGFLRSIWYR